MPSTLPVLIFITGEPEFPANESKLVFMRFSSEASKIFAPEEILVVNPLGCPIIAKRVPFSALPVVLIL